MSRRYKLETHLWSVHTEKEVFTSSVKFPMSSVAPEPELVRSPDSAGVVVHLLGWTGAQRKHLQKYADAWHSLPGNPAVIVECDHCPMGATELWSPSRFESLAAGLCDRLLAYPSRRKIVISVFSNGGGTLFAALARTIIHRQASVQINALVFDSCPGSFRSVPLLFNFLWESQRSSSARAAVVLGAPIIALLACLGLASSVRIDSSGRVTDLHARYIDAVLSYATHHHQAPPNLPVLFLYSSDDALIPASAVEAVAEAHRQLGTCNVIAKRWERSPHCRHLQTDPDGYKAACTDLLSRL